jgi:hypothetical protein
MQQGKPANSKTIVTKTRNLKPGTLNPELVTIPYLK